MMDITGSIVLFVIGFGMIGWSAYFVFKSKEALKWLTTEGIMNSCEIKEEVDSDVGSSWTVVTDYSYNVHGCAYHGKRIAFNYGSSSTREEQLTLYDKLSKAKTVLVRYNPENLSDAVLSDGLPYSTFLSAAFAILFLFIIGYTMLFEAFKGNNGLLLILFVGLLMVASGVVVLHKHIEKDNNKPIIDRIKISS